DSIKSLYPKGEEESDDSFNNSRSAKRFDDIRDLLPFAVLNNVALSGNGRAMEGLLNRLLDHPIGEFRYIGQSVLTELQKVVPSFIERSATERGAETQIYRTNVIVTKREIAQKLGLREKKEVKRDSWANLVSSTPEAEIEALAALAFSQSKYRSYQEVRDEIANLS